MKMTNIPSIEIFNSKETRKAPRAREEEPFSSYYAADVVLNQSWLRIVAQILTRKRKKKHVNAELYFNVVVLSEQ